jgi:NodT family efflux transporter outer membrane factor (OMF) lipoprotein
MVSCATPARVPIADAPVSFSISGEAETPERWWEAFDDAELNRLVEQAMGDNLDVLAAWDRLDQAVAVARIAGAPVWPNVDGAFSVTDTDVVDGRDPFVVEDTFYGLSLTASYEVDLWGRIRSGRKAAGADLRSSREDLDTVAITISSEIARTWYELLEQRSQLEILSEQTDVNQTYLRLLELRFNQGLTAAAEVLQQRQQLESTEGEVPLFESRLEVLEHNLAVLSGKHPTVDVATGGEGLSELPPLPATGLPADLLLRRPDVRAARLRVESADYRVGEAIADRFPKLSISISAQDTETKFRSLFDNWIKNLAANLMAPIVDGGRRRAEVERRRAVASERLHDFERTVLNALKEVEDALARERRQAEFIESLDKQVEIARQTVEFTRERYLNGATDYLPALTALRTLQQLERSRIEAQRQLVTFRINLYRALAGGWRLEREDSTENKIALRKGEAS